MREPFYHFYHVVVFIAKKNEPFLSSRFPSRRPASLARSRGMTRCTCASDDALEWVRRSFGECVTDTKELVGFYLALLTIACWMCAQVPQLVKNYKLKSARGLSPWFLTQWLAGDSFNLIGCLATGDQKRTQTYTAVYFVLSDVALLLQYAHYEAPNGAGRRRTTRASTRANGEEGSITEELMENYNGSVEGESESESDAEIGGRARERGGLSPVGGFVLASALARSTSGLADIMDPNDCEFNANPEWLQRFGRGIGYLATVFYLGGRLSQLAKNRRRQTVEGLSMYMFMLAVAANLSYGMSVLFASKKSDDTMRALPWLLGSLGTVVLDVSILVQSIVYKRRSARRRSS